MKYSNYDVAIIGSGMGGMCAAALLSHYGYRVLVVERLPNLGGRCSTIEYKGFKIPHVAQEQPLHGITASIFKEVGARFELAEQSPIVYRIQGKDYELPRKGGLAFLLSQICRDEAELGRIGAALRTSKNGNIPSTLSFREWLLQFTDNEQVMQLFQNVFCVLLMHTIDTASAKDVIGYFNFGMRQWSDAARPLHGNISLMKSLAGVIQKNGGDIWTRTEAQQILVSNGTANGIVVKKYGAELEISSKAVISNTGPKATIKMAGEKNIGAGYIKEINENVHQGSQILIAFTSNEPLVEYPGGLGLLGARNVVTISTITLTCPGLSPPGKYLLTAQCQPRCIFGQLDREKEISAAIEDLREQIPDFADKAEILTISCFFNEEWPGYRNLAGYYPPQKTPIDYLYNVGDGVVPFGECGTPGAALTARIVVNDLKEHIRPGVD